MTGIRQQNRQWVAAQRSHLQRFLASALLPLTALALVGCLSGPQGKTPAGPTADALQVRLAANTVPFFEMFHLGMSAETTRAVAGTFARRGHWQASALLISEQAASLAYRLPLKAIHFGERVSSLLPGSSHLTLLHTGKSERLSRVELQTYGWAIDTYPGMDALRDYLQRLFPGAKAEFVGEVDSFQLKEATAEALLTIRYQAERFYAVAGSVPQPAPYMLLTLTARAGEE